MTGKMSVKHISIPACGRWKSTTVWLPPECFDEKPLGDNKDDLIRLDAMANIISFDSHPLQIHD